jgi:hypothetical protein
MAGIELEQSFQKTDRLVVALIGGEPSGGEINRVTTKLGGGVWRVTGGGSGCCCAALPAEIQRSTASGRGAGFLRS